MKAAEKARLYRELGKLLAADFHLDRSMTLLLGQRQPPVTRAWLEGLRQGLAAGQGVAESVRGLPEGLAGGMETALIEAGERSGRLAQALAHLARYFEAEVEARRQARGALIYPLLLVHLAVVLPEVPAAVQAETGLAGFATAVLARLALLWGGLVALAYVWRAAARRAALAPGLDVWLARLPLAGAARRHWALARFCLVFHSGLLAALRMSECCRLAGSASQSGSLRAGAERAARLVELEGRSLALALAEAGGFEPGYVNALATAEEAGSLDEEMRRWALAETMEAEAAVQRAATWLPRAGYALVVLYVVWRIFEMAAGYFGQIKSLMDAV